MDDKHYIKDGKVYERSEGLASLIVPDKEIGKLETKWDGTQEAKSWSGDVIASVSKPTWSGETTATIKGQEGTLEEAKFSDHYELHGSKIFRPSRSDASEDEGDSQKRDFDGSSSEGSSGGYAGSYSGGSTGDTSSGLGIFFTFVLLAGVGAVVLVSNIRSPSSSHAKPPTPPVAARSAQNTPSQSGRIRNPLEDKEFMASIYALGGRKPESIAKPDQTTRLRRPNVAQTQKLVRPSNRVAPVVIEYAARVRNLTRVPINFGFKGSNGWLQCTIRAGETRLLSISNMPIVIQWDVTFAPNIAMSSATLATSYVKGRSLSQRERSIAPISYFKATRFGTIILTR